MLKNTMHELEKRNIKGRILTSNYLNFSEPKALRDLLSLHNLDVRVYTKSAFHTKGYLFQKNGYKTLLVGSSNLTQFALKSNKEWNLKITSLDNGEILHETESAFDDMWNDAVELTPEWIDHYERIYGQAKELRKQEKHLNRTAVDFTPNAMQREASRSLAMLRESGENKALVVSATATGKTYLSAYDVKRSSAKKVLFLVHRENILKKAQESYHRVLGDDISSGILSGGHKDYGSDFLFSTTTMMGRMEVRERFNSDYFDYIVIDETHRAGSKSYRDIISYFKPRFLLGMTATPERTDHYDIYQLFDYNIGYEIRLQQAMKEDLLCPFHYFGISEINVNGQEIDQLTDFRYLVSDQRIDHIISKIEYYGYSGFRARGLVFCSRIKEAVELSRQFNDRGYRTLCLSGEHSESVRNEAIRRLELDAGAECIDYIFTVDIFNEGIDIPSLNQIIMLRPTQSSIIFVQQLGRGLRKHDDKEYVVVLDFIGNYQQNYWIPIALSGDRTYNKDNIRRFVSESNRMIPGCSTISFDEITKKKIYASIDQASFNDVKFYKDEYYQLKNKIGRIPLIRDFEKHGSIDITKYFSKFGSYQSFLIKHEKEYNVKFHAIELEILQFMAQKLSDGKRPDELLLLKLLIDQESISTSNYKKRMNEEYNVKIDQYRLESSLRFLSGEFRITTDKKKFRHSELLSLEQNIIKISKNIGRLLKNENFKSELMEYIEFGLKRYELLYADVYNSTAFGLYQKYNYEDVCHLLNWKRNMISLNIGGYFYDSYTKTLPVFINYVKEEGSVAYEDRFISPEHLIALSKKNRTIDSDDAKRFYNSKEREIEILLFVRKNKDDHEAKEFYFLGSITTAGEPNPVKLSESNTDAFEIEYRLETPVREDIYEYLTT